MFVKLSNTKNNQLSDIRYHIMSAVTCNDDDKERKKKEKEKKKREKKKKKFSRTGFEPVT